MQAPFWAKWKPGRYHRRLKYAGGKLGFEAHIWRGEQPGPVLLLNGATHGDEYEGPTLLNEMAANWNPSDLRGTVIAVPVLNEPAFFAGRRDTPLDGKNLARVFPGDPEGIPTEQLAYTFRTKLIAHATHYADFHSAGAAYEIWPWVGYCMVDDATILETQRHMARCFSNFWCWGSAYLPGRTLSAAWEHRVPAIYVECQGRGTVEQKDLKQLRQGLNRLLLALEILPGKVQLKPHAVVRESATRNEGYLQIDHPAPFDGLLTSIIRVGTPLKQGDLIGTVQPLNGKAAKEVLAARGGRAVFVRRQRSVRKGDALATVVPIS